MQKSGAYTPKKRKRSPKLTKTMLWECVQMFHILVKYLVPDIVFFEQYVSDYTFVGFKALHNRSSRALMYKKEVPPPFVPNVKV